MIAIDRIPPFLRAFEVEISCPTTAQMEIWVGALMTSRQELLETFPLALTGVKSSSGNFFFYTSSLAFKFLHKEICPLATQVLSVATTRKTESFFIRDYDVEVEDGFESTNDTDSNESSEKKLQMQMNL